MESIFIFFLILLLIIADIFMYLKLKKTDQNLETVQHNLKNLEEISRFFPDFLKHGERLTKDISQEISVKQSALKQLIQNAEGIYDKLEVVEDKLEKGTLDKDTLEKILILINQGFTPKDISPKLNIPEGEIELLIKLKKYLNTPIREKL